MTSCLILANRNYNFTHSRLLAQSPSSTEEHDMHRAMRCATLDIAYLGSMRTRYNTVFQNKVFVIASLNVLSFKILHSSNDHVLMEGYRTRYRHARERKRLASRSDHRKERKRESVRMSRIRRAHSRHQHARHPRAMMMMRRRSKKNGRSLCQHRKG